MAVTKISTIAVGAGGAASISFTSIPATYTDLYLVCSLRDTTAGQYADINITVNSLTAGAGRVLYSINGTSASSYAPATAAMLQSTAGGATASTWSTSGAYFANYTSTGVKTVNSENYCESNSAAASVTLCATSITNGAAINTLTIVAPASNTFVQYSSATLYGILKGTSGGTVVA